MRLRRPALATATRQKGQYGLAATLHRNKPHQQRHAASRSAPFSDETGSLVSRRRRRRHTTYPRPEVGVRVPVPRLREPREGPRLQACRALSGRRPSRCDSAPWEPRAALHGQCRSVRRAPVDSASATTRSPTSKVMGTSSFATRPAYRPALAPGSVTACCPRDRRACHRCSRARYRVASRTDESRPGASGWPRSRSRTPRGALPWRMDASRRTTAPRPGSWPQGQSATRYSPEAAIARRSRPIAIRRRWERRQ